MPVYWSMLVMSAIIGVLCYITPRKIKIIDDEEISKVRIGYVLLFVGYFVFFIGFRDKVLDTGAYIENFNEIPMSFTEVIANLSIVKNGKGFYLIAAIFKLYILNNHYAWLFFLAIISCFFLFKTLYKYSIDFPLSAYLFIATTTFTWLLNGSRQFLVVCILFGFADWIIRGDKIQYIMLAILLSTIHSSAIFIAIIVVFISAEEILGKKMICFVAITVVGTYYSENVFAFFAELSETFDYSSSMTLDAGSNILRFFVAFTPLLIVLLNYRNVKQIAPPDIKLAINMSLVGNCFYFASTFTNGILVGRMPIYFTVYNLYLLPWVIRNCFTQDSKKFVWIFCVGLYFIFFYYQMCIAWDGLMYVSDVLNINYL